MTRDFFIGIGIGIEFRISIRISHQPMLEILEKISMKAQTVFAFTLLTAFFLCGCLFPCYGADIRLMIPRYEAEETASSGVTRFIGQPMKGRGGKPVYTEKTLQDFVDSLQGKRYRVKQIELRLSGKSESGSVTRWFIAGEKEAGIKVILTPR
jgi:hypothetical protein